MQKRPSRPYYLLHLVKLIADRLHNPQGVELLTIPLLVENLSSAATGATLISLEVLNPSACDSISIAEFNDVSRVNPGKRLFTLNRSDPIFRGMNEVLGNLIVTMKRERRPRRLLQVSIGTYSTNMRARRHSFTVHLTQRGFAVRGVKMDYCY